jgi:anti-anti-sigma factor
MPVSPLVADAHLDGRLGRVELAGEFDLAGVPMAQRALQRILATSPSTVAIDLKRVTFLDSSGLHFILEARDRCALNNVGFKLCEVPDAVQRVLDITGLNDVLPFES